MSTITRDQFEKFCDEIATQLPSLLSGVRGQGQQTERALNELFVRVCAHLGLDPSKRESGLENSAGFRLMQTLEEHMRDEFPYTTIMDEHLLVHIKPN
ncbi:MAG: hypothetical protein JO340_07370 [Acidobacteriaceae bacterium]|nr:hypothetical protein [Acidobacteriaceae bacterium]